MESESQGRLPAERRYDRLRRSDQVSSLEGADPDVVQHRNTNGGVCISDFPQAWLQINLAVSILPIEHARIDLGRTGSTPCCLFYLRTARLEFPRKEWTELVPTVVEFLANVAGLFGSVVE